MIKWKTTFISGNNPSGVTSECIDVVVFVVVIPGSFVFSCAIKRIIAE